MKFEVPGLEFSKSLARIARRVKGNQPWQRCLTFVASGETVTVSWADNVTRFSLDLPAVVEEEGTLVCQGRLLAELARAIAEPRKKLKFEFSDDTILTLKSGRQTVHLHTIEPDDMPVVAEVEGTRVTIPRDVYDRMVAQVVIAASSDGTRPVLDGVKFELGSEESVFATADGYRLAMLATDKIEAAEKTEFVVDALSLKEFGQLMIGKDDDIELTVSKDGKRVQLVAGVATLITPLIDGKFPDFRALIPDDSKSTVTVDRKSLIQCVKTVTSNQSSNTLLIATRDDTESEGKEMYLQGGDKLDRGAETRTLGRLDVVQKGDDVQIGVNRSYLMECLQALTGDVVDLLFGAGAAPILVQEGDDGAYKHVIMPMYVDSKAFKEAA